MGVTPSPSADEINETLKAMHLSDEELEWVRRRSNDSCEYVPEGFFDKTAEEWLNEFQIKFGKLFDAFDRGNPDEVAIEIELLYLDYKYVKSIRDLFNKFLRSSCNYLSLKGRRDVVQRILEDIPVDYIFAPDGSVEQELALIKDRSRDVFIPGYKKPKEEDWPEIDEEKKS